MFQSISTVAPANWNDQMKNLLKVLALGCLLALHCGQASAAGISAERHADIDKLLTMTNALTLGKQMSDFMVQTMAGALKSSNPKIPDKVIAALPEITNDVISEQMPVFKEMLIALYAQYYTAEDIKALIDFYSSDIGQKPIQVMPALMQDSMSRGAAWGQGLGPEIARRLKARFKKDNINIDI